MATTPLTSSKLVRGTEYLPAIAGTATTLGAGNGIVVTMKKAHKLVLLLRSAAGASTMTIKAGAGQAGASTFSGGAPAQAPAESAGQGDKVTAATAGANGLAVIVVEPARHAQIAAGQALTYTVEFSATGDAFFAFEVPA